MFATAPRHFLFFGDVHFHWRESCSLVRAIAERLAFGASARTPIIAAGLDGLNDGKLLGRDGFAHKLFQLPT